MLLGTYHLLTMTFETFKMTFYILLSIEIKCAKLLELNDTWLLWRRIR